MFYYPVNMFRSCQFPSQASCADPEGGGAGGPDFNPLKNQKNTGFLSNLPDPLKNHKATIELAFNVGLS